MSLDLRCTILSALTLLVVPIQFSLAQESGAVKVYRDQFVELHVRAKAILSRSEEQGRGAQATDNERVILNSREEIQALTKLVHTLGEDAARSYVDGLRRALEKTKAVQESASPSKTLLMIQSGCDEMSFVLGSLDSFLETGDRSFLGFAKKGDELTSSIEAVL